MAARRASATSNPSFPPYTLNDRVVSLVGAIGESLGRISRAGPAPLRLRRANRIRTVQGSVAIEGNTLSEEQVSAVLEGRRVFAPPRDILEVRNAWAAYEQLDQWQPAREADLLQAHARLMDGLLDAPGQYRRKPAGIMGRQGVLHVAPPAERVPFLTRQLLAWLAQTDAHALVAAAVFHYEFEVIHPFADGNGRLGRLWQTLILARWNPLFADIPVERLVHRHQAAYYQAINDANQRADAAPFVEFMLALILDALGTDHVTDQVSDQVKRLLAALGRTPLSARRLMEKLGLSHLPTFRQNYLRPALDAGLITMTRPDSPRARDQRYARVSRG